MEVRGKSGWSPFFCEVEFIDEVVSGREENRKIDKERILLLV